MSSPSWQRACTTSVSSRLVRRFSFLSWWHERLISDAVSDPAHHLFTDRSGLTGCRHCGDTNCQDPGLNVAYWNAHERPITTDDGHIQKAGGAPLRFFTSSGYSPEKPWLLSKHMGANPRVRLSEQPELRNLCDEYAEALRIHGFAEYSKIEYGLGATGDGLELTAEIRALVRKELVEGSPPELLPDPYSSPEEFRQWLTAPKIQRVAVRSAELKIICGRFERTCAALFLIPEGSTSATSTTG